MSDLHKTSQSKPYSWEHPNVVNAISGCWIGVMIAIVVLALFLNMVGYSGCTVTVRFHVPVEMRMDIGDTITVIGKSQKGKDRIQQNGDRWKVITSDPCVTILNNRPGVLLEAPNGFQRWMAMIDDPDFEVVTPTSEPEDIISEPE